MRAALGAHPQRGKPSPGFLPAKAYTSTAMPLLHSQIGRSVLLPQAPERACRQPAPYLLAQKVSALAEHGSNGMLPPCSRAQDHWHLQSNNNPLCFTIGKPPISTKCIKTYRSHPCSCRWCSLWEFT